MKKLLIVAATCFVVVAIGCKAQYGCPGSGRNVGAERINGGDKKTMKEVKKAGKFKYGKIPSY